MSYNIPAPVNGLWSRSQNPGTQTVTFNNIPGGYHLLELVIFGRSSSNSADWISTYLKFNNDAGNYGTGRLIVINGGGVNNYAYNPSGSDGFDVGSVPGFFASGTDSGQIIVQIPGYSQSSLSKRFYTHNGFGGNSGGNEFLVYGSALYRQTAPVTRLDVKLAAGNFVNGSDLAIYLR